MPEPQPYLFVSYASIDRERVLPLIDRLEAAGVQTWIDREGIHGGANYALEIAEAIEHAAAILLMCSPASLSSRNVKQEIALGWRFEKPYLPLLLEPVEIPKDVAYWLEGSQWIEVFDRGAQGWLEDVGQALEPLGLRLSPAPEQDAGPRRERPLLVGREREQRLLRAQLEGMLQGHGGVMLVGGEAGIGKTTLVQDLDIQAEEAGALVLWGHAYDLSVTPPYGPWLEIFRRYQTQASGLPPLPAFVEHAEELPRVGSQETLFVALAEFLCSVAAQQPLALMLDDLHWADQASLDFFRFMARQVSGQRVLLIATYRTDEVHRRHPLFTLLPLLVREAGAERLEIRPLDADGHRALIRSRYSLPQAAETRLETYLADHAEGNPLYAGELLRTLEEEGVLARHNGNWVLGDLEQVRVPPLLRQVIEARLARLDEESQRLLGVASVIGQTVHLAVWIAVGEVDEDALLELAERAEEARLLEGLPDGSGVRFSHALIREALYEGIPGIRRRRLHRQIGEMLASSISPDPDAVAYHFQQAGDARAAEWLIKAADRAQRAYAWPTAVERFEAALAKLTEQGAPALERVVVLCRIAFVLRYVNPAQALTLLAEAHRLALEAGDQGLAACAVFVTGLLQYYQGNMRQGLAAMTQGRADLRGLSAPSRAWIASFTGIDLGRVEGTMAALLACTGRLSEAAELGEAAIAEQPPPILRAGQGGSPYVDGFLGVGLAHALLGEWQAAQGTFQHARALYQTMEHHHMVANACLHELELVQLPYIATDLDGRSRLAAAGEEAAKLSSAVVPRSVPTRWAALPTLVIEGIWNEAREVAAAAYGERRWTFRLFCAHWLAFLAYQQGDVGEAQRVIAAVLPDGPQTEPGNTFIWPALALQRLAAEMALDANDLPACRAWLESHDRWLQWSGAVFGRAKGDLLWARYHHAGDDQAAARRHAESALAQAAEPRQPLALIAVQRFLGQLDRLGQRFGEAEEHLRESLALADTCHAPFERALSLLALAPLRMTQREPEEARRLLDETRSICEPLGAKPTLERVAALEERLAATSAPEPPK